MLGIDSEKIPIAFGKVLRRYRIAAGLSQEQLASEAEVQRNFISLIELGHNQPTISTVLKLSHALGLSAQTLIGDTESELGL